VQRIHASAVVFRRLLDIRESNIIDNGLMLK